MNWRLKLQSGMTIQICDIYELIINKIHYYYDHHHYDHHHYDHHLFQKQHSKKV